VIDSLYDEAALQCSPPHSNILRVRGNPDVRRRRGWVAATTQRRSEHRQGAAQGGCQGMSATLIARAPGWTGSVLLGGVLLLLCDSLSGP
jgi:hypothetical protein